MFLSYFPFLYRLVNGVAGGDREGGIPPPISEIKKLQKCAMSGKNFPKSGVVLATPMGVVLATPMRIYSYVNIIELSGSSIDIIELSGSSIAWLAIRCPSITV